LKTFIVLLLAVVLCSSCAGTAKFSRIYGTKNANLHGISIYKNSPSADISYKNLGKIEAKGSGAIFIAQVDNGLENLALEAKNLGANGIINWKAKSGLFCVMMEGDAVAFERSPED
jgi:hypothetical protein